MKLQQLAKDPAPMPKKVSNPENSSKKKTEDGDWHGNNDYHQMDDPEGFKKLDAIDGHKQQQNIDADD